MVQCSAQHAPGPVSVSSTRWEGAGRGREGRTILREIGGRYPCPVCLSLGESIDINKPHESKDSSPQKG